MHLSDTVMDQAVDCVLNDGVLVYPTETVYGLGGNAEAGHVVQRVRNIKGRDGHKPMLLLTDEWERVRPYVTNLTGLHVRLMKHRPRPALTILFDSDPNAFTTMRGSSTLIGIRCTTHPFCRALIQRTNRLLCSTSANCTGHLPVHRFNELDPELIRQVDLAVDAGQDLMGTPSTIVQIVDQHIEVLREGAVSRLVLMAIKNG